MALVESHGLAGARSAPTGLGVRQSRSEVPWMYRLLPAAIFAGALLGAAPAGAEQFVNASSNFCLDTDGAATNGGHVRMWDCVSHPNQTWTLRQLDGDSIQFENAASGFCLDTDGANVNGGQVRAWECAGHPNQIWDMVPLGDNRYRIVNKASGYCLDTDGQAVNGGQVRMWECGSHGNQTWSVRPAPLPELRRIDSRVPERDSRRLVSRERPRDALPGNLPAGLEAQLRKRVRFGEKNATVTPPTPGQTQQPLAVLRDTLWQRMPIPVCWENPGVFTNERAWVQTAVQSTWAQETRVRFSGWTTCPPPHLLSTYGGIRILIADTGPHTSGLGTRIAGRLGGMVLNFTFNEWGRRCRASLTMRQFCIRAIAVHEFGHALGIAHEQNRDDWPGGPCDLQGSDPDWNVTPYDLASVMNYCNPNWNGNGALSTLDIEGARHLYGWPRSLSVKVAGVGREGEGAGAGWADINSNGIPDLLFMAYDAPEGQNSFKYRLGWDVKPTGTATAWSKSIKTNGLGRGGDGAGLVLADINRNGRTDLLLLAYDASAGQNGFKYKIAWDLNSDGSAASWSPRIFVDGVGHEGDGAGADIADINGNGIPDLVLMAYDAPDGPNNFKYRIGWDLKADGTANSWSGAIEINGLGHLGEGAAVAVDDVDKDGRLDMVLFAHDAPQAQNYYIYRILWGIDNSGRPSSLGQFTRALPGTGHSGDGSGLEILDVDGDGGKEFILMAYDAPQGQNAFKYKVFFDVF